MQPRTCRGLIWLLLSVPLSVLAPHSNSADALWYYCEPSHAYYPYVAACAVPWRQIIANSGTTYKPPMMQSPLAVAPSPTPAAPDASLPQSSSAYTQGQADRQAWGSLFAAQTGEIRAGAYYGSGQRSLPRPGSCSAAPPSTGLEWTNGCHAAQQRLATSDARRKTEPEYPARLE